MPSRAIVAATSFSICCATALPSMIRADMARVSITAGAMILCMLSIWVALWLLANAADDTPPSHGRLCIGDANAVLTDASCSEATAATIAIQPADRERRFHWLSDD